MMGSKEYALRFGCSVLLMLFTIFYTWMCYRVWDELIDLVHRTNTSWEVATIFIASSIVGLFWLYGMMIAVGLLPPLFLSDPMGNSEKKEQKSVDDFRDME